MIRSYPGSDEVIDNDGGLCLLRKWQFAVNRRNKLTPRGIRYTSCDPRRTTHGIRYKPYYMWLNIATYSEIHTTYDVYCTSYSIRYTTNVIQWNIYDIWYNIYDIRYTIYDITTYGKIYTLFNCTAHFISYVVIRCMTYDISMYYVR